LRPLARWRVMHGLVKAVAILFFFKTNYVKQKITKNIAKNHSIVSDDGFRLGMLRFLRGYQHRPEEVV
jgi:hypothetical protein